MSLNRSLIAPTFHPPLEQALKHKLARRQESAGSLGELEPLAVRLGLSARQLQRRVKGGFGYGPKHLTRVLRLQRALGLARAGTPFAEVSAVTGYADQAHLSRDVRAMAGVPLGELVQ